MARRNAGNGLILSNVSLEALRPRLSDRVAFVSYGKEGSKADHPNNDRHLLALGGPTSVTPISGILALWLCVSAFQRVCPVQRNSVTACSSLKRGKAEKKYTKKLALECPYGSGLPLTAKCTKTLSVSI